MLLTMVVGGNVEVVGNDLCFKLWMRLDAVRLVKHYLHLKKKKSKTKPKKKTPKKQRKVWTEMLLIPPHDQDKTCVSLPQWTGKHHLKLKKSTWFLLSAESLSQYCTWVQNLLSFFFFSFSFFFF